MEQNEHLIIQTVANINKMYYSIAKNIVLNNNSFDTLINPHITAIDSFESRDSSQDPTRNTVTVNNNVSINRDSNTVYINRNIDQEYDFEEVIEEEAVKKTRSDIKLGYFKSIISKKS